MQNAECRMQNDLIPLTLHSQGKNDSAERGVRNTERLCSAELRKQGKLCECRTQNAERLHFANAPLTRKDYISAEC